MKQLVEGFKLDRPVYTPREAAAVYTRYVHRVTYATFLQWIQVHAATDGREGVKAAQSPRNKRYYITQDELRRILLRGGAKEESETSGQ